MDRVFPDANVLLSAALRPKAGLLRLWTLANATLITSDHAIEEARRNLDAPGQRARLTRLLRKVEVVGFHHFTSLCRAASTSRRRTVPSSWPRSTRGRLTS